MSKNAIINTILFFILILAQVLICNHIMLFNVAVPFIFIYFIIRLPMSLNTNWLLTLSFLAGLIVDIFSDTPGLNAMSCTILAIAKKPAFFAYIPRDDRTKDVDPSINSLGISVYSKFLLTMVTIYCLLVFTIEYFSFAAVREIVIMGAASSVLTFLLILSIDSLTFAKT